MNKGKTPFKDYVQHFYLTYAGRKIPYGIGCAWLGRSEMDQETIRQEVSVLQTAYDLGFRYYDTSAAYGESERIVGEFVRQIPRDSIFLASKSRVPQTATPKEAREYVLHSIDSTLSRMKTDCLDLFQVHDVEDLAQVLASDGVLNGLIAAKSKGMIRFIGLATRNHELLKTAVTHGSFDTILTYSDYTPLDQSAQWLISLANQRYIGVINASPLSAGFLTGQDPRNIDIPNHLEYIKRKDLATQLYDLCHEHSINILELALQFPISNPCIDLTLTGPASVAELETTLASLTRPLPASAWEIWRTWKQDS